ncbi:MAG: hypothetical protein ACXWJZ_12795, partial [Burkholderiaceae bacterium]
IDEICGTYFLASCLYRSIDTVRESDASLGQDFRHAILLYGFYLAERFVFPQVINPYAAIA